MTTHRPPLDLDDLARLTTLREIALSPDGRTAAVTLERVDEARNVLRRRIVALDVARPRRRRTIATGRGKLGSPRWSPDGSRLAYVSHRGGTPQVWVHELDGGASMRVSDHPVGAAAPAWSPDGTALAFVARGADVAGDEVVPDEQDPKRRVIRVRGHRHRLEGTGYLVGQVAHIWVTDLERGSARQLTDGRTEDAQPAWSPDGRSIAFVSDRSPDRDRHFGGTAIHVVDAASGEVRRLSAEGATATNPSWSPDGRSIAYLRAETVNEVDGRRDRLWVVDATTGAEVCLTPDLERSLGFRPGGYRTASLPAWAPDAASILQLLADAGTTQLVRVAVAGGEPPKHLTDGRHVVQDFSSDRAMSRVLLSVTDAVTPPDLWLWEPGSGLRPLVGFNDSLLAERDLSRPRRLTVSRPDGHAIEGWLFVPVADAAQDGDGSLALVLSVHGGPHNAFGETFNADLQLFAAYGYAVLAVNPRGSGSYDEAFARAVVGDWGGADFEDILAVLDAVVAGPEPRIDPDRLAITGGSYGGFMTCWAITRTDRFAVAIAGAPITNFESEYGTADIGPTWFRDEQGGPPSDRAEHYRRNSPLTSAARVRTPLLLYHGEDDMRCPVEQSEQFFTALTALGRDVELIRVPGEGHALPGDASPVHRRLVREAIHEWLVRYLGPDPASAGR